MSIYLNIKIGNAPCSWGVLEFDEFKQSNKTQKLCSSSQCVVDYKQYLQELVEAGYRATELGDLGYMPTDSEQLCKDFKYNLMDMIGAFVPYELCK